MKELNKCLELGAVAKITETLVSSEESFSSDDLIEQLENYCNNPWGKKFEFEIENEECENIEFSITCNAENEYLFELDKIGGSDTFFTAKEIVEHINDNIDDWFNSIYS